MKLNDGGIVARLARALEKIGLVSVTSRPAPEPVYQIAANARGMASKHYGGK